MSSTWSIPNRISAIVTLLRKQEAGSTAFAHRHTYWSARAPLRSSDRQATSAIPPFSANPFARAGIPIVFQGLFIIPVHHPLQVNIGSNVSAFCRYQFRAAVVALAASLAAPGCAVAQTSGRLLATSGVVQAEGAGGGGLVPWALITGYGTRDQIGANLHATAVPLSDFTLGTAGVAAGFHDRIELSYAHEWFDTGKAGSRLGLGNGYQFHLDVAGIKVRLHGNAVYDQDDWLPEISVGTQLKSADQHAVLRAIGARSTDGVDVYLAATKLFLAQSLLVDLTVRATEANQFGLLGFGGDRDGGYSPQFEGSAAFLVTRRLAIGAELRTKPDNLRFAREGNAYDVFAAYFLDKHVSTTLAFADLGPIARQGDQTGAYLSLELGF